jgi:hypothetical protein
MKQSPQTKPITADPHPTEEVVDPRSMTLSFRLFLGVGVIAIPIIGMVYMLWLMGEL